MNRLFTESLRWIDELSRLRPRWISDRLIRHIEDIDAVRECAAMTQEELLSRVSEEMNARAYALTAVASIFLPPGFFPGLAGVNVGGMPGAENSGAFRMVVALCVGTLAAPALSSRRKRWF